MRRCTGLASLLLFSLAAAAPLRGGDRVEIHLTGGAWTLSPFVTMLERETEALIEDELTRVLGDVLPAGIALVPFSRLDLSSSGGYAGVSAWLDLGASRRFGVGGQVQYMDSRMPYALSAEQTVSIWGWDLAGLRVRADGRVRLRTGAVSLLGRWTAVRGRRVELFVSAGATLLAFDGRLSMRQDSVLTTPLGDVDSTSSFELPIDEIRDWNRSVPALIFSPRAGLGLAIRLTDGLGLLVEAATSQGSFLGAGLSWTFGR